MVDFVDLKRQYRSIKPEIDAAISKVLESTAFARSPFVKSFEEKFARAHECSYCSCVSSGTAALHIALWALGIGKGDEVIVPVNTFIATAEAVSLTGAKPVFVDCDESYNIDPSKIEDAITDKTEAIIAVHLYGRPAEMESIASVVVKHNLYLIEDCAQSHLAKYENRSVGTFGICGCFSFYPSKNLGAYGEGGAVVTNEKSLYDKINLIRDHGGKDHEILGHNYRMSGLQGAILETKLKYLPLWIKRRRENASLYRKHLSDVKWVTLPEDKSHTYHLFVIRAEYRDRLAEFLKDNQVSTGIHYPVPCHKKGNFPRAEKYAKEILSLPMFPELTEKEIIYVCDKIKEFYR